MRPEQAEIWLSRARFNQYMDVCDGDHDRAVLLYEWNIRLSAAFLEVLCHVEVTLRNAIDQQFPATPEDESISMERSGTWLTDPAILEEAGLEQVENAIQRLEAEGEVPTRDWIVAKLSFGFWAALFSGRYEVLWRENLRGAFPGGNGKRREVADLMQSTGIFRNRIAHHEAIFHRLPRRRHEKILRLIEIIDPEASAYISGQSRVVRLLDESPPPSGYNGR